MNVGGGGGVEGGEFLVVVIVRWDGCLRGGVGVGEADGGIALG